MNKSELKERWGKYTDTDKLVDDIMSLLTKYRHRNSEHGVCKMLDEYFTNKSPLIEMFQRSEHYIGNMRIVVEREFERENSASEIMQFVSKFPDKIGASEAILKKTDGDGKTATDYLKVGVVRFDAARLKDEEFVGQFQRTLDGLSAFSHTGYTKESETAFGQFCSMISNFRRITVPTLSTATAQTLKDIRSDIKLSAGMKTSRAFNRICNEFKVDTLSAYNKLFAEYADMVSGLNRTMQYVISVNPYDYLTMSFGKSWASCHTIDKNNIRQMPNSYSGAYCGGTLSYMLDKTSIITYVVGKNDDIQTDGKVYRNMFHYGNNIMVQGRVYPQANDGAVDLYERFRGFMQEEMTVMLGLEKNLWTIKKGNKECERWTSSTGNHYRDYNYVSNCNVTFPSERKNDIAEIVIGHLGICPYCGERHNMSSWLSHDTCRL